MDESPSSTEMPVPRPADQPDAAKLMPIGQVVANLQRAFPEVTHSSLRFLERERLVMPTRTPGGHRLYSEQDLARIRQIKAWQAQRLSLDEIRRRVSELEQIESPAAIADRFLTTALVGDLAGAAAVIRGADDLGMPLAQLFDEVLRPALYDVGARWESGALPVGQEKEISELARDLIAELSRRHADLDPRGPVAVAACVAGERHDLGLRMVAGLLRERGWRLHFLGPDVDPCFLAEVISLRRPDVVLLSATTEARLPEFASAIEAIQTRHEVTGMAVVAGGQAISNSADILRSRGVVPVADGGAQAVLSLVGR